MTQLASLDLSGHAAISDASIAEIARHLTVLTHLDLRKPACESPGAEIVGDDGIVALSSLTLLESIRLSQAQVRLLTQIVRLPMPYRMLTCFQLARYAGGHSLASRMFHLLALASNAGGQDYFAEEYIKLVRE